MKMIRLMTNTEAQKVLGNMLMRHDLTDAELEAIGIAGEALEEEKWISVKEKMPEINERVLVSVLNAKNQPVQYVLRFNHGDRWHDDDWEYKRVTHWRHLPEPPEVEEE